MTSTSSKPKKKKSLEKVTLSDGTVFMMTTGNAHDVRKKNRGRAIIPAEKQNTELPSEETFEEDEYDSLDFPPPIRNKAFREIWGKGIKNITSRKNFDPIHLTLFETYCSLLVTLRRLNEFISQNGETYRVTTALGENRRTHPEVLERNKAIAQIGNYARLLGLLPKADSLEKVPPGQESDWS